MGRWWRVRALDQHPAYSSGSVCVGAWVASTSVYLCFHTQETVGRSLCALRGGGWADPESGPDTVASAACVRQVSGVTVV